MLKEFIITIYLLCTRILFNLMKCFPKRQKYVFVSSFGDNVEYVAREVLQAELGDVVILRSKRSRYPYERLSRERVTSIQYDAMNPITYIKSMYHLATAKTVFVDNYFAFLSVMNFKKDVECIQLWHAAGAIKRFGFEDPSNIGRPLAAYQRFERVYARFHKIIVGSDEMADVFQKAFNCSTDQFLTTGIPRTDFFHDEEALEKAAAKVTSTYPQIADKKVVMYAPTFRRNQLEQPSIALDVKRMCEELGDDYIIFVRLHPAVSSKQSSFTHARVIDVSNYPIINDLLVVTDVLISDYSSLPYEFALLEKPQLFFAYDVETYSRESGFWHAYESVVPGPIVRSTDEIIQHIKAEHYNLNGIRAFSAKWNMYSNGTASKNIIKYLTQKDEKN